MVTFSFAHLSAKLVCFCTAANVCRTKVYILTSLAGDDHYTTIVRPLSEAVHLQIRRYIILTACRKLCEVQYLLRRDIPRGDQVWQNVTLSAIFLIFCWIQGGRKYVSVKEYYAQGAIAEIKEFEIGINPVGRLCAPSAKLLLLRSRWNWKACLIGAPLSFSGEKPEMRN